MVQGQSAVPEVASGKSFAWEEGLAPNFLDDPYALTEAIIENYPSLFFAKPSNAQMGDGLWVATRFDVVREILQNNELYSSADGYPYFKLIGENLRAIPLQMDVPEHTSYRKFLEPRFSPRAVTALAPRIRAVVDELIDSFADAGECDVSHDFTRVYPVRVFMEIMGFPREAFEDFLS